MTLTNKMEYKIRKLKKEDTNFFLSSAKSYIVHNAHAYKSVAKEIGFAEVETHLKKRLDKVYIIADVLDEDTIMGYICLDHETDIKKIYALYVRPEHRSQGIASKLISFFIPPEETYLYCFPSHIFREIKQRNRHAFKKGLESVAIFYESGNE